MSLKNTHRRDAKHPEWRVLFSAVRVGLLAVLIVVVFDLIIPPGREPAFLKGSQWRPVLSQAGQQGLRALPPDIEAYIDRLKRERGI